MVRHFTQHEHRKPSHGALLWAVSAAAVLGGVAVAARAQFTVTEFYDAPAVNAAIDPDVEPAVPGVQSTLRSVIQHINTLPPGAYSVSVPSGTFLFTITGAGEDNAATGDIDVHRSVTITGAGLGVTYLDAAGLGDRLLDVRAPVTLRLHGLGIYRGTAAGNESGGAVRAPAGSDVEIYQCEFSMNSASGGTSARGGAIDAQGSLKITGFSTFYGNSATGIGGAIYLNGPGIIDDAHFFVNHSDRDGGAIRTTNAGPTLRLTNSSFDGDTSGGSGGALNLRSPAEIDSCLFVNAHADAVGGSIGLLGAGVRVMNSVFRANRSDSGGGAINVAGGGDLYASDSLFEGNFALTSGGAITNSSVCRVRRSAFVHNAADGSVGPELGGGAVYNFGTLELTNVTMSGNVSPGGLGGAVLNLTGGQADLTHVTLYGNHSLSGSAVHNGTPSGGAVMRLTHTVLANAPGVVDPLVAGVSLPLVSLGYNLDSDGTAGLAGVGDQAGTVGAPVDAMLSPLGMHGGATPTHLPSPGSPCLNTGSVSHSVDPAGNVVTVDQRGHPRPSGAPDIGAVEVLCVGDWNNDGVVNVFDVFAYMLSFHAQDPGADIAPAFGVLDIFDLFEFLRLYQIGC